MFSWLRKLWAAETVDAQVLAAQRDAQSLRLDLQERDAAVTRLKAELADARASSEARLEAALDARLESLLLDVATPVAQLNTQAHLLEVVGKELRARDVMAVAKRFVRVFEDNGLRLDGQVGAEIAFDPDRHTALQASAQPGQNVSVRFVGVSFQGRVLCKAGVEIAE